MNVHRLYLIGFMLAALFAHAVSGAEPTYYERFTEALTNGQRGFMRGADLVDTNNWRPTLTNAPIAFKKFTEGELAGIRLGMTISEVVEAWGKPNGLYSHCGIGPRFWYVPGRYFGDVSLSFKRDRLVLIGVSGDAAKHLVFDSGLSGSDGRADFEKVLGEPSIRDPKDLSLYNGEIAYRAGLLRTDYRFESSGVSPPTDHLLCASVSIEAQARSGHLGEQGASPNAAPPHR
jgi:hypothetical protein